MLEDNEENMPGKFKNVFGICIGYLCSNYIVWSNSLIWCLRCSRKLAIVISLVAINVIVLVRKTDHRKAE